MPLLGNWLGKKTWAQCCTCIWDACGAVSETSQETDVWVSGLLGIRVVDQMPGKQVWREEWIGPATEITVFKEHERDACRGSWVSTRDGEGQWGEWQVMATTGRNCFRHSWQIWKLLRGQANRGLEISITFGDMEVTCDPRKNKFHVVAGRSLLNST